MCCLKVQSYLILCLKREITQTNSIKIHAYISVFIYLYIAPIYNVAIIRIKVVIGCSNLKVRTVKLG